MKNKLRVAIVGCMMLVAHLSAQMNPSSKREKDIIRQYGFFVYSVATKKCLQRCNFLCLQRCKKLFVYIVAKNMFTALQFVFVYSFSTNDFLFFLLRDWAPGTEVHMVAYKTDKA